MLNLIIVVIIIVICITIFVIIAQRAKRKNKPAQQQGNTPAPTGNVTAPPPVKNVKVKTSSTGSGAGSTILEVIGTIILWTAIIVFIILGIRYLKNHHNSQKVIKKVERNVNTLPDKYTKTYFLKKGEVVRVNIPDGYKCDYFGGGKKYYHQAQNSEKEIWGGNSKCPTGLGNPNAKYADISYYNEEITVVCEFKRIH